MHYIRNIGVLSLSTANKLFTLKIVPVLTKGFRVNIVPPKREMNLIML
jgi:hypothetical protein